MRSQKPLGHQRQQIFVNALPVLLKIDCPNLDPVQPIHEIVRQRRIHGRIKQHHFANIRQFPHRQVGQVGVDLKKMRRPKRLGFVMMLRRLRCEFAVDDDFPGCRCQADIGLHLGQQACGNLVGCNPTPVNVLALHLVIRVDSVKSANEVLKQNGHLPLVADKIHKLAAA